MGTDSVKLFNKTLGDLRPRLVGICDHVSIKTPNGSAHFAINFDDAEPTREITNARPKYGDFFSERRRRCRLTMSPREHRQSRMSACEFGHTIH